MRWAIAAGVLVLALGASGVVALAGGSGGTVRTQLVAGAPARDCVTWPLLCGYPDPANTGVPAGTRLTPSGPITVTTPGTVISALDVTGTITVQANDVTIENTRVTAANPSGSAVFIAPKVSGTVVRDSTLQGADAGRRSIQYGILNAGWPPNASTQATRLRIVRCSNCYAGPGTLRDSYVDVSAVVPGAHYEPIYYGGGAGPLTVDHNTLLNPQPQTAIVFAGTDYGPQQGLTITNNLMAGGGWMVYGGSANRATRDITVTGNRFSRRYFPKGGHFGVAAYMVWSRTRWEGNTWDDTHQPVHG